MIEEAGILRRQDRPPDVRRELGQAYPDAACAVRVETLGHQFRLEPGRPRVGVELIAGARGRRPVESENAPHLARALHQAETQELRRAEFATPAMRAAIDPEDLVPPEVLARPSGAPVDPAIAEPLEAAGQLRPLDRHARDEPIWRTPDPHVVAAQRLGERWIVRPERGR
jgi:hypothetical protein